MCWCTRKGATRAFGRRTIREVTPSVPTTSASRCSSPADMGTRYSWVLDRTAPVRHGRNTFGTTCHGAGRLLSRTSARKKAKGRRIDKEMRQKGIEVKSKGYRTLAEEMSEAYKDVADVVDVIDGAGVSRKVARLVPLGVIKG